MKPSRTQEQVEMETASRRRSSATDNVVSIAARTCAIRHVTQVLAISGRHAIIMMHRQESVRRSAMAVARAAATGSLLWRSARVLAVAGRIRQIIVEVRIVVFQVPLLLFPLFFSKF